jgi:transposase
MKLFHFFFLLFCVCNKIVSAQAVIPPATESDTLHQAIAGSVNSIPSDSIKTILLHDVNIVAFKSDSEWMQYYKYKSRIEKVLPYVKIAKQLYAEIKEEKENDKKREFRHYRKDLEKEMREKFEKELKDLTIGQGEMLFKLINRETGNNAYTIIKDIKGGFTAWFYELVGKHWGYDLKDNYDPKKEKMIELIIRQMGSSYNV